MNEKVLKTLEYHKIISFLVEKADYDGYLALEKENPERIIGIDAGRGIDDIKEDIYEKLEELLKGVAE